MILEGSIDIKEIIVGGVWEANREGRNIFHIGEKVYDVTCKD